MAILSSQKLSNCKIKGEEYKGTMSIPRPWWEGLGEGVNCYNISNSKIVKAICRKDIAVKIIIAIGGKFYYSSRI